MLTLELDLAIIPERESGAKKGPHDLQPADISEAPVLPLHSFHLPHHVGSWEATQRAHGKVEVEPPKAILYDLLTEYLHTSNRCCRLE